MLNFDVMSKEKSRLNKRKAYLRSIVHIYENDAATSSVELSVAHQKDIDDMKPRAEHQEC